VTERLLRWVTIGVVGLAALWFVDTRAGLLKAHHGSPALALIIDAGLVVAVAVVVGIRRMRR
jgi:hypothetical protein